MVVLGALVREECSIKSKARLGTVVKVSDIVLGKDSQWESELRRWKDINSDIHGCYIIRPGKVASVRWQSDPTKLTVHIFYNDCEGQSQFNYHSNSIEVVS